MAGAFANHHPRVWAQAWVLAQARAPAWDSWQPSLRGQRSMTSRNQKRQRHRASHLASTRHSDSLSAHMRASWRRARTPLHRASTQRCPCAPPQREAGRQARYSLRRRICSEKRHIYDGIVSEVLLIAAEEREPVMIRTSACTARGCALNRTMRSFPSLGASLNFGLARRCRASRIRAYPCVPSPSYRKAPFATAKGASLCIGFSRTVALLDRT